MAIIDRIPRADLGVKWKHKGWFAFCPVYIDDCRSSNVTLCERNWVPEFVMALAHWVLVITMQVIATFDEDYEPRFKFTVTGKLSPP
jgi:hypothetical protein